MPTDPRDGDFDLGLCRVREQERRHSIVVPARAILRGVVTVGDREHPGEYTVVDSLDTDMYLRLMEIFPDRDVKPPR